MKQLDLTVVIPTKGRPSLRNALDSLQPNNQMECTTDVLVIYDNCGTEPLSYLSKKEVSELCKQMNARVLVYDAGFNDWGYPQLEFGYKNGGCENYIMNIGDDDVMVKGIVPEMMRIIERNGIQPYLFQAELWPSKNRGNTNPVILWNDSDRSIERSKVTGQNLVVPNIPHLFGQMTDDFEFIRTTIERWHGLVQWVPLVTTRCF